MQLPDVKTLLNDSNLLTVKATTQLQKSYKLEQAKLKALKHNYLIMRSLDIIKIKSKR